MPTRFNGFSVQTEVVCFMEVKQILYKGGMYNWRKCNLLSIFNPIPSKRARIPPFFIAATVVFTTYVYTTVFSEKICRK